MSFSNLGLNPLILKAIESSGYPAPTAVQTASIPAALEGHDLLVSSHTGSGKTAAFLLPSLQRLTQPSTLLRLVLTQSRIRFIVQYVQWRVA